MGLGQDTVSLLVDDLFLPRGGCPSFPFDPPVGPASCDVKVRLSAALNLGRSGAGDNRAVNALATVLQLNPFLIEPEAVVRGTAADALRKIITADVDVNTRNKAIIALAVSAGNDPDPRVREFAFRAHEAVKGLFVQPTEIAPPVVVAPPARSQGGDRGVSRRASALDVVLLSLGGLAVAGIVVLVVRRS